MTRRATLMLILATLCWGLSFPLMKQWMLAAGDCPGGALTANFTLMGLRMLLGLFIFALLRPDLFRAPAWRELRLGAVLGLLNCAGMTLQMLGLVQTTPALSGFFTSLASVWVPLLAFACFGTSVARPVLWGLVVSLIGAAVLGIDPRQPWLMGGGEVLTLLSTFIFAVVILALDRWGRTVRSANLTLPLVLMTGLPAIPLALWSASRGEGVAAWLTWLGTVFQNQEAVSAMIQLTIFSTVCATLWMSTYQPRVPIARAALIYFLEPVFATAFSVAFGFDSLTILLFVGGGLILLGNLLVELPLWLREVPGQATTNGTSVSS